MTIRIDWDDWLERPVSAREHRDAELAHDLFRLRWAQQLVLPEIALYRYHRIRATPRAIPLPAAPVIPGGLDLLTTQEPHCGGEVTRRPPPARE
jgi:hypothetical protein